MIKKKKVLTIVAHPDDEILWCGGLLLQNKNWNKTIITLCRDTDKDRAPKFRRVLDYLNAHGKMGDIDDGPDQLPIPPEKLAKTIAGLIAEKTFDLVLTHGPFGEYTRHIRHEECSKAVLKMWQDGQICTSELWMFVYEDGGKTYLPKPRSDADKKIRLPGEIWLEKRKIITEYYGFGESSWETKTTPKDEGYWCFDSYMTAFSRIKKLKDDL